MSVRTESKTAASMSRQSAPTRRTMAMLGMAVLVATVVATNARGATTTTPLTLEQIVDMAIASSLERRIATAELQAQHERTREAEAGFGPRVEAAATAADYDRPATLYLAGKTFLMRPEQYRAATLTVKQPLTELYGLWQQAGMLKTQERIDELDVSIKRIDAAFAAAETYRRIQEAAEQETIAKASIAATEHQEHDAQSLVDSGSMIKSDLLKFAIAKEEAKATLARASARKNRALAYLAYLIDVPTLDAASLEASHPADRRLAVTKAADSMLSQDLKSANTLAAAEAARLDVRQADLAVAKAEYGKRLADARYLPKVDAAVSWDRLYDAPPVGNLPYTRTFSLRATWELWDNGSRVFAHREALAEVEKSSAVADAAKSKLRVQLSNLQADLKAADEALSAALATVAQAEEAYRLDSLRFKNGLVTATDLVLSETAQTRARGALISALTEVDVLTLMSQKALGASRPQ